MLRSPISFVFSHSLSAVICLVVFGSYAQIQAQDQPRAFAPGVLKTIPTQLDPRDTHSLPGPMPGIVAEDWTPNLSPVEDTLFGKSKQVTLYRDPVWELEFSFLPLRQEKVKLPSPAGGLQNSNVWYLVVRVRNTGSAMTYEDVRQSQDTDHVIRKLQYNKPVDSADIDFAPRFVLQGWIEDHATGNYKKIEYAAEINPTALSQIQEIEDPNQKLLDTHQLSKAKIPMAKNEVDPGVWAVAIWEGVNPNIDYVSVQVSGLSNARRLKDPETKASFAKTLQLNFWRPGDAVGQHRDQLSYGIPLVDDANEQIRICKFYQLPGPMLRTYLNRKAVKRKVLIGEIDANVNLETFKSKLTEGLNAGNLPAALTQPIAKAGIDLPAGAALTTVIPGRKWSFSNEGQEYIVQLEPQFWEPDFGQIRFIKTLDYLWIYR